MHVISCINNNIYNYNNNTNYNTKASDKLKKPLSYYYKMLLIKNIIFISTYGPEKKQIEYNTAALTE